MSIKIDFASMDRKQIREYAKDELGVSLPVTLSKADMIVKLKELHPEEAVTTPIGEGKASDGNEQKRPVAVIINIPEDGDDAQNYIRVNEGDRAFQIMKGVDTKIPYGVYDNLKCAIESLPVKKMIDGKQKIVMRERPRITFSVIEFIYA